MPSLCFFAWTLCPRTDPIDRPTDPHFNLVPFPSPLERWRNAEALSARFIDLPAAGARGRRHLQDRDVNEISRKFLNMTVLVCTIKKKKLVLVGAISEHYENFREVSLTALPQD